MESKTVITAIIIQIVIFLGGLITWYFKSKREDRIIIEEKSREYKIKTYETLLEPIIVLFTTSVTNKQKEIGGDKLLSVEYRKAAFNLGTFGSDEAIRAYNRLMQAFYNIDSSKMDEKDKNMFPLLMMTFLSDFLLCIRKDLYSKKSKLKRSETLEFMIKDMENYSKAIDSLKPNKNLYSLYRKSKF